jgi:hypothetical protein
VWLHALRKVQAVNTAEFVVFILVGILLGGLLIQPLGHLIGFFLLNALHTKRSKDGKCGSKWCSCYEEKKDV